MNRHKILKFNSVTCLEIELWLVCYSGGGAARSAGCGLTCLMTYFRALVNRRKGSVVWDVTATAIAFGSQTSL